MRCRGRWRTVSSTLTVALCVLGGTAACSASAGSGSGTDDQQVTVLAAASLTQAFGELKTVYEDEHPGTRVSLSFGPSSMMAHKVIQGDPADVLATEGGRAMRTVTDQDLTNGSPKTFATDPLVLITPPRDPGHVSEVADLDAREVTYAACVPTAPCGTAVKQLLTFNQVSTRPSARMPTVKGVVHAVARGRVDAGLVYASEAHAAQSRVRTVKVAHAYGVVDACPIAVLTNSTDPSAAAEWVDLVRSPHGQSILTSYGFGPADAD